jgi:hypothetical protein
MVMKGLTSRHGRCTPENEHRYPLNRRLGGQPEPVWAFWRSEKYLARTGIKTPDRPSRAIPLAAIPTTLTRLPNHLYTRLFMARQTIMGQGLLIVEASWSHSDTPHSVGLISATQRPLPDNTQHSQATDNNACGGIRTHNPSKRVAVDPRLRSRGHREGH